MQTQISTTESSLLSAGLLFESTPPTGPIDPPDNTGGGGTTSTPTPTQGEEPKSEKQ